MLEEETCDIPMRGYQWGDCYWYYHNCYRHYPCGCNFVLSQNYPLDRNTMKLCFYFIYERWKKIKICFRLYFCYIMGDAKIKHQKHNSYIQCYQWNHIFVHPAPSLNFPSPCSSSLHLICSLSFVPYSHTHKIRNQCKTTMAMRHRSSRHAEGDEA